MNQASAPRRPRIAGIVVAADPRAKRPLRPHRFGRRLTDKPQPVLYFPAMRGADALFDAEHDMPDMFAPPVGAPEDVGALWADVAQGDGAAQARLLSAYYAEFRTIARRVLRDDGGQLALQPTDLAHEAAIRILRLDRVRWQGRTHFLATAARVMRQTLIDEVRRFKAGKRRPAEVLTQWPEAAADRAVPLDRLDEALEGLFKIDADRARIVELRFFAGLTLEEIAHVLDVSESTVVRRWRGARAWLLQALRETD